MTTPTPPVPSSSMDKTPAGLVFGMIGVASFSLTLPMTRLAVADIDALQVAIWRGFVAGILAIVLLIIMRPRLPFRSELKPLALCAFGIVFGFPLFTTLAMQTVSAAHGAIVVGLLPLATAVVGALISDERPSLAFWLTGILGTVLTLAFVMRQTEGGLAIGHVFLLLAVLTAAIGYAYGGQLSKSMGGWQTVCWALAASFPLVLIAALFVPISFATATPASLTGFLYVAVISQLAGFFFWYRGMAMAGIVRVSQLQLTQLFLTLIASVWLLDEQIGLDVVIFGSLVVATVWAGTRFRIQRKS